jgi:hypothetical protein
VLKASDDDGEGKGMAAGPSRAEESTDSVDIADNDEGGKRRTWEKFI